MPPAAAPAGAFMPEFMGELADAPEFWLYIGPGFEPGFGPDPAADPAAAPGMEPNEEYGAIPPEGQGVGCPAAADCEGAKAPVAAA